MRLFAMCASTMPDGREREPAPRTTSSRKDGEQTGDRRRDERHRQHAGAGQVQPLRDGVEIAARRVRRREDVPPVREAVRPRRPASSTRLTCAQHRRPCDRSLRRQPAEDRDRPVASAAVVHARVLHAEHRRVLVLEERGVHDLAEEQRVVADLDRLAHLAVEVRHGLVEHRRAGDGPSVYGKPLSVRAARSTSTGFVNLRTIARSSRSMRQRLNTPPAAISSCVNASRSTPMPSSFGSKTTCVAQLSVMRLRRVARSVDPTTYNPLGIFQSTRRRRRSYSSGSAPSGNGGTGPSLTGTR